MLCWHQTEWLTWGQVLSGIFTYIVTYVNISSPGMTGLTLQRAAFPKPQGIRPLCPLSEDTMVTQLWDQASRFTPPPPQSKEVAPQPTLPLPSPVGAFQGATIGLEFMRGRKPHRSMAGAPFLSDTFLPHHSRPLGVEHTAGRHLPAHGFAF